jgi:type III pantothenate kinase
LSIFVDIGNSNIKLVSYDKGFGKLVSIKYDKSLFKVSISEKIKEFSVPEEIFCVCVAEDHVKNEFSQLCLDKWNIAPNFLGASKSCLGVSNAYEDFNQLGADRWMAIIAAWDKVKDGVIVIDFGSALTIDIVNSEAKHLGGYILPSEHLMQKTLTVNTNIQSDFEDKKINFEPGVNTAECIENATVRATLSFIVDLHETLNENCKYRSLITGGGALKYLAYLSIPHEYEPLLVFEGMRLTKESMR